MLSASQIAALLEPYLNVPRGTPATRSANVPRGTSPALSIAVSNVPRGASAEPASPISNPPPPATPPPSFWSETPESPCSSFPANVPRGTSGADPASLANVPRGTLPAPDWPRICDQLAVYLELILRWNARTNLTAIRSPEEIVRRHFGESLFAGLHLPALLAWRDSLANLPAANPGVPRGTPPDRTQNVPRGTSRLNAEADANVPRGTSESNADPALNVPRGTLEFGQDVSGTVPRGTVLDLGSGAGFPGLPIQLLYPSLAVTLAESQGKKASFLREVVRTLGLTTEVWAARAELFPAERRFDVVTLRAVDDMASAVAEARRRAGHALLILTTRAAAPGLSGFDTAEFPLPGSSDGILLAATLPDVPRGTSAV